MNFKILFLIGVFLLMVFTESQAGQEIVLNTLIGEGLGEGVVGMTAIAETIRNRAIMRNLRPSDVCLQPKQYSFWNNKELALKWLNKNRTDEAVKKAQKAWEDSLKSNLTKGAVNYHTKKIKPYWSFKMKQTVIIGNHVFYKDN